MILEIKRDIKSEVDSYTLIQYYPLSILKMIAMNLVEMAIHKLDEGELYRYEHPSRMITVMGIRFIGLEEWV